MPGLGRAQSDFEADATAGLKVRKKAGTVAGLLCCVVNLMTAVALDR